VATGRVRGGERGPAFAPFAESLFAAQSARVRTRTVRYYRDGLDLVLLPRLGRHPLTAIDADSIAKLTRDLECDGLHANRPEAAGAASRAVEREQLPEAPAGHPSARGAAGADRVESVRSADRGRPASTG